MTEEITTAIEYFSAYEDYFWRWAEHGRVIEFANKKTICYREDLAYLLGQLPNDLQLPLGSILLILCACKDNWESLYEVEQQLMRLSLAPGFSSAGYLQAEKVKNEAYAFLKVVNALPVQQRSGMGRTTLIRDIISVIKKDEKLPDIHAMVKQLNSGELDYTILRHRKKLAFETICADLAPLADAFQFFPTREALELKLKTGLLSLPSKAPLSLPEQDGADLLGQLDEDHQTRLLSNLTRKLLAAIRIPMHLSGSSDYALGGVADISNQGNYDQLLLSELAQDELLLTARLANNEALFLQRETPPDNAMQELGIFIDMSLKMWGMPRIMAIATGLAFREAKLKNQQMKVWGIGRTAQALDLDTKNGVVAALEVLDPALHCGEQLVQTVKKQSTPKGKSILVTAEGFLQDPAATAYFHRIREQLNFLVMVNRNGHIRLVRLTRGRQELVNEALINLDDLLYKAVKNSKRSAVTGDLPAVLLEETFPLYYPTSKVKMDQLNTYVGQHKQVVIITQDRRVLCWPEKGKGAIELIDFLPHGSYCFGETHSDIYLLLNGAKAEMIKVFYLNPGKGITELYEIAPRQQTGYDIKFINQDFYLGGPKGVDILNLETMQMTAANEQETQAFKTHQPVIQHYKNFNHLKKQINSGYSVINSVKHIFLHPDGQLYLDRRALQLVHGQFAWQDSPLSLAVLIKPVREQPLPVAHLPNIKFTRFIWKSGSEVILDSRGLLHLRTADRRIPEICILLVVDQPTACWSSDGVVSGWSYFTGKTGTPQTEPAIFYKNYIQRFIATLN